MAQLTEIELQRKLRMERNNEFFAECGITVATEALAKSKKPETSPRKPMQRRKSLDAAFIEVRKSERVQRMPPKSYADLDEADFRRRLSRGGGRRTGGPYKSRGTTWTCPNAARAAASAKAELIQVEGPSFVKDLTPSMVSGGFWLQWPVWWCLENMPENDVWITLLDNDGVSWPSKYLGFKKGLSAGWRGYAIEKGLKDGDAMVFQVLDKNLDRGFCDAHLPAEERIVLLESARALERTWQAIYKPVRGAFSGGWRAFSIDNDLRDGDAAVFEVVDKEKWRVKVHIVRAEGNEAASEEDEDEAFIHEEEAIPSITADSDHAPAKLVKEPSVESPVRKRAKLSKIYEVVKPKQAAGKRQKLKKGEKQEELEKEDKPKQAGGTKQKRKKREGESDEEDEQSEEELIEESREGLKRCEVDVIEDRRVSAEGVVFWLLRIAGKQERVWVENANVSEDSCYCWLSGSEEVHDP